MDIESAYRLILVHPQDRILQVVEWEGKIYVDPMLPFGLRSAPNFFNAVADALNWCLQRARIRFILHYLDDFIVIAPPAVKRMPAGSDNTGLSLFSAGHTHGTPQAGWSHDLPHLSGHPGGYGDRRAAPARGEVA